jgi:hypothetical protein
MDLIIFQDGLFFVVPVTVDLLAGEIWKNCFDLCDILRDKLTIYNSDINRYVMKNGSFFFWCICK